MSSTHWKPGQSGNPSGRPKVDMEVRQLCQMFGREAVKILIDIARNSKKEIYRIAAAQTLLDRGFGKPNQSVNVTSETPYVLLAPTPAASGDDWLNQARAQGVDVPKSNGYNPDSLN